MDTCADRPCIADVYRATDQVLDRDVAVKLLRDVTGDPVEKTRFSRQARALAQLSHRSLVTVLDAGIDVQQPFLVVELVDGPSLAVILMEGGLPAGDVADVAAQVADALACVHGAGVVHRDVKPGNVLIGIDGRIRLGDFGIARLLSDAPRRTRAGVTTGSAYLAPEQVRGDEVTTAVDIYSLGLVLLEAYTGEPVYRGSPTESALARLQGSPVLPADLPARWEAPLAAMTSLDPVDRPTAHQVSSFFSSWQTDALARERDAVHVDSEDSTRSLPAADGDVTAEEASPFTLRAQPPGSRRASRGAPAQMQVRAAQYAERGRAWLHTSASRGTAYVGDLLNHPRGGLAFFLVTLAVISLTLWMLALGGAPDQRGRTPPSPAGGQVPERLAEPLSDLHDATALPGRAPEPHDARHPGGRRAGRAQPAGA